jgi:hypothetical protein
MEQMMRRKFYIAGGNMTYMFHKNIKEIQTELDNEMKLVSDPLILFDQHGSFEKTEHLIALAQGKGDPYNYSFYDAICHPHSEYVARSVFDRVSTAKIQQALGKVTQNYPKEVLDWMNVISFFHQIKATTVKSPKPKPVTFYRWSDPSTPQFSIQVRKTYDANFFFDKKALTTPTALLPIQPQYFAPGWDAAVLTQENNKHILRFFCFLKREPIALCKKYFLPVLESVFHLLNGKTVEEVEAKSSWSQMKMFDAEIITCYPKGELADEKAIRERKPTAVESDHFVDGRFGLRSEFLQDCRRRLFFPVLLSLRFVLLHAFVCFYFLSSRLSSSCSEIGLSLSGRRPCPNCWRVLSRSFERRLFV